MRIKYGYLYCTLNTNLFSRPLRLSEWLIHLGHSLLMLSIQPIYSELIHKVDIVAFYCIFLVNIGFHRTYNFDGVYNANGRRFVANRLSAMLLEVI